jgi:hypothetical protein
MDAQPPWQQQQQPIPEWRDVDAALFDREIAPLHRPAVLRSVVGDWPVVARARRSPQAVCDYLKAFDSGVPVNAIMMAPAEQGVVGYDASLAGFSFVRNRLPLSNVIDQLQRYLPGGRAAPALAAQSAPVAECLPGFLAEHQLALLPPEVLPRIWLGNHVTVPAHFDEAHNIACCVSGRRRFTLFPPEQVGNLYIGPLDFTPAGAPVSLASRGAAFGGPDFARYPRFRDALAASFVAELAPGDAIYIPPIWWHQVESVGTLNILVNYWWGGAIGSSAGGADRIASPTNSLMHSLLHLKALSPELRQAWKAVFDHFVFDAGADSLAHIPPERRGVLGTQTPEEIRRLKDALIAQLQK